MAADQVTGASPEPVWKGILASTRPVRLRGEDRVVGFAREALEGMAAQISQGFVPLNYGAFAEMWGAGWLRVPE